MGSVGCYGSQNEPEGNFSTEPLSWGTDYSNRGHAGGQRDRREQRGTDVDSSTEVDKLVPSNTCETQEHRGTEGNKKGQRETDL